MPILKNPNRELFAQELAKGKTQVEAYEAAGYKRHDSNAAKLASEPEVAGRVAEIIGRGAVRAEVTLASLLGELEEARQLALTEKQSAAAVSATIGKAKLTGLIIDRSQNVPFDLSRLSEEELAAFERLSQKASLAALH